MNEMIKCDNCGQILLEGSGQILCLFSEGVSIECRKCGNKYIFGTQNLLENMIKEIENDS